MRPQQQTAVMTATTNKLAGVWLLALSAVLGLTVLCTAALVAWPLVGYISTRFFG